MRLNKYLASAGVSSRRGADQLIESGQVKINHQVVRELGTVIDPVKDVIKVKGRVVRPESEFVTYLLNKPRGVVTTASDPLGRKTVLEFLPKTPRVFPCGRLDADTQGLVILTNDGNLCYELTHPKFEHQKEYLVHGEAKNPEDALDKIRRGVVLKDGSIKPDRLTLIKSGREKMEFSVIIHEGRNRIIRRLCAAVGIEIKTLTRLRVGNYELGDLAPGEYKKV